MRMVIEEKEKVFMNPVKGMSLALLRKAGVDRAVLLGVMTKLWYVVSGLVTLLAIANKFSPQLQGYYYAFSSIIAFQFLVELGLNNIIVQFASHEWAGLLLNKNAEIIGEAAALSRLQSVARFFFRWYLGASIILTVGLMIFGSFFFSRNQGTGIIWMPPWLALCICNGALFCLVPIWSLLEGCNQLLKLYSFRLLQAIVLSLSLWAAVLSGAQLWSLAISNLLVIICALLFLAYRCRNFLKALLFSRPAGPRIDWRKEIFMLQWRIAMAWLVGSFAFTLFVPVLFKYHGPVIAGQMGMTWTFAALVLSISSSWLSPKVPQFGIFIAKKQYKELDKLFWRTTKMVSFVAIVAAFFAWSMVYALNIINSPLAMRLLPPLPTGIFLIAQVILSVSAPFSLYLRAHKKEPVAFLSVIAGIFIGLSTFILGKRYSALGVAAGYLLINAILVPIIIIIWDRCRIEWHADELAQNRQEAGPMPNIWKKTLNMIKTRGTLGFITKAVFFVIGQLVCFFLYPICRLMNIKFIPVNYAVIGHLAGELDCYIKEGRLGLHPPYKTVMLVSRKDVANPHLLSYWKKYVRVIDNPVLFSLLWAPIKRNKLITYNVWRYFHIGKYFYGNFTSLFYTKIQKQYYGRPPVLSLTDFDRKRGWDTLRKLGVPENAWFICVHCRESGYSYQRGRDIAAIHDADVNNYFPAMQEIVDRGGWVIRVGDPFMKPIPKMKNVIDYAHLDIKSDWMDVFLCASCRFLLGSNSGLSTLPGIFGVPSAIANVGGPISAVLPYGPEDIGIPKFIWSEKEKRYLNFREILSSPIGDFPFDHLFAANNIKAVENSPEDIKELAIEMMDRLEGRPEYSEEDECLQARFKSLMKPGHYSYGAISRVGKNFLKKYEYML